MGQHDAATEPLAELAGKPVILVVEDELLVRIVQVDILREAGFRVAEAQDADEAFDMLRRRPEIAAVLTDVDMPGSPQWLRVCPTCEARLAGGGRAHHLREDASCVGRPASGCRVCAKTDRKSGPR